MTVASSGQELAVGELLVEGLGMKLFFSSGKSYIQHLKDGCTGADGGWGSLRFATASLRALWGLKAPPRP